MRLFDILTAGIFAALVGSPLVSIVLFGFSPLAENPPTWEKVLAKDIILPSDKARDVLTKSLVSSSPVGMAAISANGWLNYSVFGYVNTSSVISGRDGWLFYKPEFGGGRCPDKKVIRRLLLQTEAMQAVALGGGIKVVISVSPDKSVVHPEMLETRSYATAGCKLRGAAEWRRLAGELGIDLIDHARAFDGKPDGLPVYGATDTHWNDAGRVLVFRHLAREVLHRDTGEPKFLKPVTQQVSGDLIRMLRLDISLPEATYPDLWNGSFVNGEGYDGKAIILHDSFYRGLKKPLESLFPAAQWMHVAGADFARVEKPDLILVNSVERHFFGRLRTGPLSQSSPFGTYLMANNASAAEECKYRDVPDDHIKLVNITPDGRVVASSRILVRVPKTDRDFCLRIEWDGNRGESSQMFLPRKIGGVRYHSGLQLKFPGNSGRRTILVKLPARYSGNTVRLDPVRSPGTLERLKVEIGE